MSAREVVAALAVQRAELAAELRRRELAALTDAELRARLATLDAGLDAGLGPAVVTPCPTASGADATGERLALARMGSSLRKPWRGGPRSRSEGRLYQAIETAVRGEIEAALRETDGNVTHAAQALGVTRDALIKRLRSLAINAAGFRK